MLETISRFYDQQQVMCSLEKKCNPSSAVSNTYMHILWLDFHLLVTSQVRNTEDLVVEIIEMWYQTLPRKTDVWREERRELELLVVWVLVFLSDCTGFFIGVVCIRSAFSSTPPIQIFYTTEYSLDINSKIDLLVELIFR